MNGLRFIKRAWQALPLSDYNRWRITKLLLEPLLPLIKGSVVHTAYLREKEWQMKCIRPFYGDDFPALPSQVKEDIFMWGVIDWRFRIQRPQHLARGFSEEKGHRVFYISTAFVNTGCPGFEVEQMDAMGRLLNVRLHLKGRPPVYAAPPGSEDIRALMASLAKLLQWTQSQSVVSIVQHPYWYELAKKVPASRLIYDCMDHHAGFSNTGEGIAAFEKVLLKDAELVVTTSQFLWDVAILQNPNVALIRNATDYKFFSDTPALIFQDKQQRRVIGYYGAIAHWMDVDLLEKVALRFRDCLLLLVGTDECGARSRLASLSNVCFTGEVKYEVLPHYLHGMDVCLLPFKLTPLTLATNPVKVYEYLSAGKPVVAIDLPELVQFGSLVATATSHDEFLEKIEEALVSHDNGLQCIRQAFAARNTWQERVDEFALLLRRLSESPLT